MAPQSRPLLGELMVEHGLVTQEQVEEALRRQRSSLKYIGEILIEMGAVSRRDVMRMLELQHMLAREAEQEQDKSPPE
jgi:type IV pilus assembly protein PilB